MKPNKSATETQRYGRFALPMADSPRIESRLRAILAGGPVASLTAPQWRRTCGAAAVAAVLLVGSAAMVRPVAAHHPARERKHTEVAVISGKREPPRKAGVPRNYINSLPPKPRWTRTAFDGKVTLELVGVSQRKDGKPKPPYGSNPYTGFPLDRFDAQRIITKSWSPEGRLYPQPLYLAGTLHSSDIPSARFVEYALRVRNKGVSDLDFAAWDFVNTGSKDGFVPSDGIWCAYEMVKPEDRTAHVKFLVCGGAYPWHEDLPVNFNSEGTTLDDSTVTNLGGKEASIHLTGPVYNAKGDYGFVVTCSSLPYDVRAVAVGKAGKEFDTSEGSRSVGPGEHRFIAFFDPRNLPKERVVAIRLEARPFQTVDFGDVALYPK